MDQVAEEITPFDLWHDRHRVDVALLLRYARRDAAAAADKRSQSTYNDADAVPHEVVKLQEHLLAQDHAPIDLAGRLAMVEARFAPR